MSSARLNHFKSAFRFHVFAQKGTSGDGALNRENREIEAVRLCFCIQLLRKCLANFLDLQCVCNPTQTFVLDINCSPKPYHRKNHASTNQPTLFHALNNAKNE